MVFTFSDILAGWGAILKPADTRRDPGARVLSGYAVPPGVGPCLPPGVS